MKIMFIVYVPSASYVSNPGPRCRCHNVTI